MLDKLLSPPQPQLSKMETIINSQGVRIADILGGRCRHVWAHSRYSLRRVLMPVLGAFLPCPQGRASSVVDQAPGLSGGGMALGVRVACLETELPSLPTAFTGPTAVPSWELGGDPGEGTWSRCLGPALVPKVEPGGDCDVWSRWPRGATAAHILERHGLPPAAGAAREPFPGCVARAEGALQWAVACAPPQAAPSPAVIFKPAFGSQAR